ncbi:hypothetical protein C8J57DRAFT_617 [Mycena rebaudengoi]|nr:hypothetical protein C8J57DRAFT_617 [Mycena rebaudengoi]
MTQTYELNVKSISGIDLKYRNKNLYVAIDIDSKRVHTTHPKKDSVAMWNDTSTLSPDKPSSIIGLHLYQHNGVLGFNHDKYLAKAEIEMCQLLERCSKKKDVAVSLDYVKKSKGMQEPTLFIALTTSSHIQSEEVEITNAQADIALLGCETPGFAALEVAGTVQNSGFVSALGSLIESIVKIGDEFAKVRCCGAACCPH